MHATGTRYYHSSFIKILLHIFLSDLAAPAPLGGSGTVATGGRLPESTAASTPQSVGQQAQAAGNASTSAGEIINSYYNLEIETIMMLRFVCVHCLVYDTCGSLQH